MRLVAGTRSAGEAAAGLLAGVDAREQLLLDVGGCRVQVRTNEPRLRERLQRYFRDHLTDGEAPVDFRIVAVDGPPASLDFPLTEKTPDAGKTRIKEEYVDFPDGRLVRKRLTGMVFVFGGDLHVAHGPALANDNQIVNFVINRYMQWRLLQGYVLCHAGAVAREGRGLALCGTSGAGKSTVSLALVRRGMDFVSNDRLLLRRDGAGVEIQGVPKHPRVNPGTIVHNPMLHPLVPAAALERWLAMEPEELRVLEEKHDVLIDQVVGPGRFGLRATLEGLVVIAWNGEGPPRLGRVSLDERRDLLEHVIKSPGLFYEPDGDEPVDLTPEAYLEVLSSRPTWEVTGSRDFAAVEELCMRAFEES